MFHPLFWINIQAARENRDRERVRSRAANAVAAKSGRLLLDLTAQLSRHAGLALALVASGWGAFALWIWAASPAPAGAPASVAAVTGEIGFLLSILIIQALLLALIGNHVLRLSNALTVHDQDLQSFLVAEERRVRDCTLSMCAPAAQLSALSEQIHRHHHVAVTGLMDLKPAISEAFASNRLARDFLGGCFVYMGVAASLVSVGALAVLTSLGAVSALQWAGAGLLALTPVAACMGWAVLVRRHIAARRAKLDVWDAMIDKAGLQFSEAARALGLQRTPLISS